MKGIIIDYTIQSSKGLISAENGKRYEFNNLDWKSDVSPSLNQNVDFEIEEDKAKSIYIIEAQTKKANNLYNASQIDTYGLILSIIMIGAMFMPFYRYDRLIDGEVGIMISVLSAICLILYYFGKKDILLKLSTLSIVGLVSYVYFTIFSRISDLKTFIINTTNLNLDNYFFEQFSYGSIVIITISILMLFQGFRNKLDKKVLVE